MSNLGKHRLIGMLVYKYRGIYNDEIFERDLTSIQKNYYWAANFKTLNDPFETILTKEKLLKESKLILPLLGKGSTNKFQSVMDALDLVLANTEKIGIYSLSKSYIDELLWAHYGNSHNGYCIEYDLDTLLKSHESDKVYSFPIEYKKKPASVDFMDVIKSGDSDSLIKKMAGFKSTRWEYEEEIRIITEEYGEHSYEFNAVKSIYFGLRMKEVDRIKIMKRFKGRGINYFEIKQIPKTYKFERSSIKDLHYEEPNYLRQLEISNPSNKCNFKILEKNYLRQLRKAEIRIELEKKVSEKELKLLAVKLKDEVFRKAENIYMFYYLITDRNHDFAYATSHYRNGKVEININ